MFQVAKIVFWHCRTVLKVAHCALPGVKSSLQRPKLHHANDGACDNAGQQMMTVKDVCTQDLTATDGLKKQDICIVTKNPGHFKCKNVSVKIDNYHKLRKEPADQNITNSFLRTSGNHWNAGFERLKKQFSATPIWFGCHRLVLTRQTTPPAFAYLSSKS